MAVKLETATKRFIGLSTDRKPFVGDQSDGSLGGTTLVNTDLPPGSTFFESDTGRILRWNGVSWTYPEAVSNNADTLLLEAVQLLYAEVAALRIGMIDAGNCREINLNDVATNPQK